MDTELHKLRFFDDTRCIAESFRAVSSTPLSPLFSAVYPAYFPPLCQVDRLCFFAAGRLSQRVVLCDTKARCPCVGCNVRRALLAVKESSCISLDAMPPKENGDTLGFARKFCVSLIFVRPLGRFQYPFADAVFHIHPFGRLWDAQRLSTFIFDADLFSYVVHTRLL